jgi:serine/threonine-protein kinase
VATNATVLTEPGIGTQATLQATAAGPVTVAYTVTCSGIVSPASPALSLTAQSPATTAPNGNGNGTGTGG